MIKEFEIYHGIVFARLFNTSPIAIRVASYPSSSNASYFLTNGDRTVGIYIKHCSKRLSPWRFTFLKEHQDEISKMKAEFDELFVVLVCGKNGIVILNFTELKLILDHNHESAEWICIARGKREMYTVKGKDGALDCKIGEADFPRKILDYLQLKTGLSSNDLQNDSMTAGACMVSNNQGVL